MRRWMMIIGAVLVVAVAILAELVGFWLSPQDRLQPSSAIVAISGGDTRLRVIEAVNLYRQGLAPWVIFSGAALDPSSPSNAAAMRQQALSLGVPLMAVLLDESATDTIGNATGVKKLSNQYHFNRIILVTSPYHQRRASLTFAAALGPGVQIINHSTIDNSWRRALWWDNPHSIALTWSELKKTLYVLAVGPQKLVPGVKS